MSMRLDRLATLYVFHPLASRRANRGLRIPILMYHSISDSGISGSRDAQHAYFHTATAPARFTEHMQYLRDNGYTAVRLTEALDLITTGCAPQAVRPVVITFDDGFRDFYTHAFPILARHRFPANMFLPTAFIGDHRSSFNGAACLTWDEVRELHAAGMEFGSHTVTHRRLRELPPADVEGELCRSKETIEDRLGAPVDCFSYPYAFPETLRSFVATLRNTLVRYEYRVGVSTIIGAATHSNDRFFLPRLPVNSLDDLPLFRAKLEGGYDWLHGLQRLKKTLNRVLPS
jgi:peptidoglycan/xylan/chitin deacetylase (PgdA/CDA1 family)